MSDDRLFASNNAIGRKWYFLNIIILAIITAITNYFFNTFIITSVTSEVYEIIANGILFFIFVVYAVTFFALIERRLYDATGARDKKGYKNTSGFMQLAVIFQLAIILLKHFQVSIPMDINILQDIAWVLNGIFALIVFVLCFIKGQISNMTYEQYKNKIKYE